jgi:hypothetical protein
VLIRVVVVARRRPSAERLAHEDVFDTFGYERRLERDAVEVR